MEMRLRSVQLCFWRASAQASALGADLKPLLQDCRNSRLNGSGKLVESLRSFLSEFNISYK